MSNNNRRRHAPRPAGAPAPQDHLPPRSAAQREAEGVETVTVDWRGMRFTVPARPEDWDFWKVARPLGSNNIPEACLGLLGVQQASKVHAAYPQLNSAEAARLFSELFDAIAKAAGFGSTGN